MSVEKNQGIGALIGSIIIVLLILIGGYYSLQTNNNIIPRRDLKPVEDSSNQPAQIIVTPATPAQESTEIEDIEVDIHALDLKNLDSGLENLDLLVKQEN